MKNADMPAMPCSIPSDPMAVAQAKSCGIAIPGSVSHTGFTKREEMAMRMMAGLNANPTVDINEHDMADLAVIYADALLEALERTCQK